MRTLSASAASGLSPQSGDGVVGLCELQDVAVETHSSPLEIVRDRRRQPSSKLPGAAGVRDRSAASLPRDIRAEGVVEACRQSVH